MFTPSNIIVAIIVVVVLAVGGKRIYDGIASGKSCCSDGENKGKVKKVVVDDTDESNYPYSTELMVGGMSCDGCVQNVQNALNALPGTWARVDLASKTANILSKNPIDAEAYEAAIKGAGYYVMKL